MGCNVWSIKEAEGDKIELQCETIGRTGGSVVNCLCILGIPGLGCCIGLCAMI